jgi:hypothetical protein
MKKLFVFILVFITMISSVLPVYAAEGQVTYQGDAGKFIFEPGSKHSLTDLFPDFKDVMPGDSLTQRITVRNAASNKVKVKIYIRSLGAQEGSEDFLSQLKLSVMKSADNKMEYMFEAYANETAQLTDWVCLGMLYSGGVVNLDVVLDVPVELSNEYQDQIGYLDWEFKVEEFPVEPDDPVSPDTSDESNVGLWVTISISSVVLIIIILLIGRRRDKEEEENA